MKNNQTTRSEKDGLTYEVRSQAPVLDLSVDTIYTLGEVRQGILSLSMDLNHCVNREKRLLLLSGNAVTEKKIAELEAINNLLAEARERLFASFAR